MRLGWIEFVAIITLIISSLNILPLPHGIFWKLSVGTSEWGYVLAILAIALSVYALLSTTPSWWAVFFFVSALLYGWPVLNAVITAPKAQQALKPFLQEDSPSSIISFAKLFDFSLNKQTIERHTYKTHEKHTLELEFYNAKENAQRLLVVMIHGGSWNSGDYTQLPAINHHLASKGFGVAAITYRLAPEFIFPAQLNDISDALIWLRERSAQFGFNPNCVVLGGRSAGGHLALTAAYGRPELNISGVFAYYAPNDMNWSWENPAPPHILDTPKTLSEFLGGTPATATTAYAHASPYQFVDAQAPATLLMHGGMDRLVSDRQSRRLADKLISLDVKNALIRLPWATHGCEANLSGPSGQTSTWAIEQFLNYLSTDDCS